MTSDSKTNTPTIIEIANVNGKKISVNITDVNGQKILVGIPISHVATTKVDIANIHEETISVGVDNEDDKILVDVTNVSGKQTSIDMSDVNGQKTLLDIANVYKKRNLVDITLILDTINQVIAPDLSKNNAHIAKLVTPFVDRLKQIFDQHVIIPGDIARDIIKAGYFKDDMDKLQEVSKELKQLSAIGEYRYQVADFLSSLSEQIGLQTDQMQTAADTQTATTSASSTPSFAQREQARAGNSQGKGNSRF